MHQPVQLYHAVTNQNTMFTHVSSLCRYLIKTQINNFLTLHVSKSFVQGQLFCALVALCAQYSEKNVDVQFFGVQMTHNKSQDVFMVSEVIISMHQPTTNFWQLSAATKKRSPYQQLPYFSVWKGGMRWWYDLGTKVLIPLKPHLHQHFKPVLNRFRAAM